MTDKEQIICHGVDVSKCDRLNLNSAYGWDDPDMCSIPCCNNAPNCLFKQLARVNEELQLAEQLINGILKTLNLKAYDYKADQNEILTEIKAFKQERRELKIKNVTLQNRYQQVAGATTEAACYRKAFEEIESICLEDVHTFADGTVLRYDSLDEILDIINKVKEE